MLERSVDGQWILLAFITLLCVFIFQSQNSLLSILILVGALGYCCIIFLQRKICWWYLMLPIGIIILGLVQNYSFSQQIVTDRKIQIYKIRPDLTSLRNNYYFGEACSDSKKIRFQLNPSDELISLHQVGRSYLIKVIKSEVSLIDGPTNIGEFNLRRYYKAKRIKYQVKILDYEVVPKKFSPVDLIFKFRNNLKEKIKKLPENIRFYAGELFLGENMSGGNNDLVNDFRRLGIIHLLSLSGMHVVLYTRFISFICNLLRINSRLKERLNIILLSCVCVIGNFQPGLVRASLAYILSILLSWKKISVNTLDLFGLVALIHQFFVPQLFLSVGAQLSYLMVLGLKIIPQKNLLTQSFWLNILITPILLQNFYEVNILTIIYNLGAVPIFNFIILPITLLAVFAGLFFTDIIAPCESILKFVSSGISYVGQVGFGQLTFGMIKPVIVLQIIFLLLIFIIFENQTRLRKVVLSLSFILFTGNVLLNLFPVNGQVTFIDVGQGDSIYLATPGLRKTVLIDTGGQLSFGNKPTTNSMFDKIGSQFLKSQGVSNIDAVFLSHQDADHIGDLVDLLEQFKVKTVYFGNGMQNNESFQKKISPFATRVRLIPLKSGDYLRLGSIRIRVLHPTVAGLGGNEDSLSLKIEIGGKKWIFTGDLDMAGEKEIVQNQQDIQADFLKLGHHGSRTSSDMTFLSEVKPKLAFISAGEKNRYGHPHLETLAKLQKLGIENQSTAEYGMISWYFNPFGSSWIDHFQR